MQGIKEFEELAIDGSNYLAWASDIKIGFASRGILHTINAPDANNPNITDIAKYTALLLLRTSIHKDLKKEYLLEENPRNLWVALQERYEQQKEIICPEAQHEWNHLRLQDFKSVTDYNHTVHNICTRLKFCEKEPTDAEKIQKTLSTMHPSDRVLCNQYRKENHQVYSQLIHSLIQAEKNDELLMKNHHLRPVGAAPLPEVHHAQNKALNKRKFNGSPLRNPKFPPAHRGRNFKKNLRHKENKRARGNEKIANDKPRLCHKCGCNTHFAATCRTPKHLVDLYLRSLRDGNKRSRYEAHFNQATEKDKEIGCSNNKASAQQMDDMMIEYNSGDICGDLV
jgi:hypothetical protein